MLEMLGTVQKEKARRVNDEPRKSICSVIISLLRRFFNGSVSGIIKDKFNFLCDGTLIFYGGFFNPSI